MALHFERTEFDARRDRLILEDRARNTHENAVFTKMLVQPKPGERWLLHTPGTEPDRGGEGAGVEVRLDAQRWLLLRFRDPAEAGAHWLWAQASHDPARWHLLRCALYSAAPSPAATQASRP